MAVDDKKIIYSMVKVGKTHGQKNVLQDISLSFYYGAKIGILGLNGAGKSFLLRIMAGQDDQHRARPICQIAIPSVFWSRNQSLKVVPPCDRLSKRCCRHRKVIATIRGNKSKIW